MTPGRKILIAGVAALLVLGIAFALSRQKPESTEKKPEAISRQAGEDNKTIELSETQLASVRVEAVQPRAFASKREAIGSIDFNEDKTVAVLAPYQGKIIRAFANIGDEVKKGQPLFTIDSPDLVQAESTLISSAGVYSQTSKALTRAKALLKIDGIAQKDFDQAKSDQQTAEGNFKAAENSLRVFGKTEEQIRQIVKTKKVDRILTVASPFAGKVTARNAAPGLFVQPGSTPAPYSVADISTVWLLANAPETDSPFMRVGEAIKVHVMAFPDKVFNGKISAIGASVDPNTHRISLRSEIRDPRHELRPGMFATYVVTTGASVKTPAVPVGAIVREGDGTMTVWVTDDHKHFHARTVKTGMEEDGYNQILEGLAPGELVATDGALFLDNALTETPQ